MTNEAALGMVELEIVHIYVMDDDVTEERQEDTLVTLSHINYIENFNAVSGRVWTRLGNYLKTTESLDSIEKKGSSKLVKFETLSDKKVLVNSDNILAITKNKKLGSRIIFDGIDKLVFLDVK